MEDENDNKPLEPKKQKELSSFLNLLIDFESDPDIDDEIEKIEITPLKNVNFLTCDQF